MAARQRQVVWTDQAQRMLDTAVAYVAQDSQPAAQRLLIQALDTAASLDTLSERGRVVPELNQPTVRELFVQRYRLIYEVTPAAVQILAFVHGARDLTRLGLDR
jgi:plasmid stabilization system protein ParE